jgi:site-specific DNA-adenine methylase
MTHFLIGYPGNKRQEYKEFKNKIEEKLDDVKIIVELFCGTSAISFNIYKNTPKQYKYILNDIDKNLMDFYAIIKSGKLDEFLEKVEKERQKITTKEEYNKYYKFIKNEKSSFECERLVAWYIIHKYYNIRVGLYDVNMNKTVHKPPTNLKKEFIEFIKSDSVELYNGDWFEIFDKYKNDNEAYLIFDPPYLLSCNEFYSSFKGNVYEYFAINPIKSFKSNIIFILEKNWIINLLFRNDESLEYKKKYEMTIKRETKHQAITNY